jgi:hypothetical protein
MHDPNRAARMSTVARLLCVALFFAYAGLQVAHFRSLEGVKITGDSASYLAPPSPWSRAFWLGQRAPVVPLVATALGGDPERLARFHVSFSIFAWTVLAMAAATALRSAWLAPAAFAAVLAYSLSIGILAWHKSILSESISYSLFALVVAAWIDLLRRPRASAATLAVAASALYAFTRDTNAHALVFGAGFVCVCLALARVPPARARVQLAVCAASLVLFVASAATAQSGERWIHALYNTISIRVLPYPDRVEFFEQRGMPVGEALREREGKWAGEDGKAYFVDPRLEEFRAWAHERGQRTYVSYLLHHPVYVLSAPLERLRWRLHLDIAWLAPDGFAPVMGWRWQKILFARERFPLFVAACVVAFLGCLCTPLERRRPLFLVASALLITSYPRLVLVWHASPMEVHRHTFEAVVQARLGALLLLCAFADRLISAWHDRRAVAADRR